MLSEISKAAKNFKLLGIVWILVAFTLSSCSPVAQKPYMSPTSSLNSPNPQPDAPGTPTLLPLEYFSPLPNAQYVSKDDSIILRYDRILNANDVSNIEVSILGSQSGAHTGKPVLADDNRTVVYKPDQPFLPGETIQVQVNTLRLSSGAAYQPLAYSFTVAANQKMGAVVSTAVPTATPQSAFPGDLTLPHDIPHYTVTTTSPTTAGEGYVFVAPFYWTASTVGSYLLILDNNGQIVYYQSMANQQAGYDFKVLPGGYITYYDQKDSKHVVMDSHYKIVGTYQAQNGYTADLHDFLVTPDGYVFLMAYDTETIDMSKVVPGGNPNAAVTGLIIQELDPDQNVIFEWRSWDHFNFSDSSSALTAQSIDLVHGNGLTLTSDGNLLLSSRNMNEITKISLENGAILWRLGGKNSTFQFVGDSGFAYQHDITELSNGDITLFDNHGTEQAPSASRAVEYKLDLTDKTATLVWEYIHNPPVFTDYMGDVERLPDENTFIGWGDAFATQGYIFSSMMEVTPENQILFELSFDQPYVSYRAFRAPWTGTPDTTPALAFKQGAGSLTLGYSWNGATEVASWRLYAGASPQALSLIDHKTKTSFETQSVLTNLPSSECYFQVAALDQNGKELSRSNVISTNETACPIG